MVEYGESAHARLQARIVEVKSRFADARVKMTVTACTVQPPLTNCTTNLV